MAHAGYWNTNGNVIEVSPADTYWLESALLSYSSSVLVYRSSVQRRWCQIDKQCLKYKAYLYVYAATLWLITSECLMASPCMQGAIPVHREPFRALKCDTATDVMQSTNPNISPIVLDHLIALASALTSAMFRYNLYLIGSTRGHGCPIARQIKLLYGHLVSADQRPTLLAGRELRSLADVVVYCIKNLVPHAQTIRVRVRRDVH